MADHRLSTHPLSIHNFEPPTPCFSTCKAPHFPQESSMGPLNREASTIHSSFTILPFGTLRKIA